MMKCAGTWAWGNKFLWGYATDMDPELQCIFDHAVSQGINVFDTADSYGTGALNGRSEELLGRFMSENENLAEGSSPVYIATKLAGYPWRVTPWNMTAACRCEMLHIACCPGKMSCATIKTCVAPVERHASFERV